jgi:hypothetical protein
LRSKSVHGDDFDIAGDGRLSNDTFYVSIEAPLAINVD